ncbi:hypothetical protein EDC40_101156 [Aminobacter aminovorans]|uniref:Uncharacterized protein n=1 Tax=Aminobacter aminovorans TaxID=83263 RepID=A0A380WPA9_AMIAI|nr:hypothetical protein [Aminobacter aminovorans]TCS29841.1 hypothetical protein EDC40_101156 [Aminobacter aminovorans]SUU90690.1 Uncharacterised protein [Aminobacter aminovorans]
MAYETNGFKLLTDGLSGASSMKTWLLDSVDAIATVNTSNYVSDGHARGARQGDIVIVRTRTTTLAGPVTAIHHCWVIDEKTGSDGRGIDLTDGLAITATDTD